MPSERLKFEAQLEDEAQLLLERDINQVFGSKEDLGKSSAQLDADRRRKLYSAFERELPGLSQGIREFQDNQKALIEILQTDSEEIQKILGTPGSKESIAVTRSLVQQFGQLSDRSKQQGAVIFGFQQQLAELTETIRQQDSELQGSRSASEQQVQALEQEIAALRAQLERQTGSSQAQEQQNKEQIAQLEAVITQSRSQRDQALIETQQLQQRLEEERGRIGQLEPQNEALRGNVQRLEKTVEQLTAQAQSGKDEATANFASKVGELATAQSEIERLNERIRLSEQEQINLKAQLAANQEQIEQQRNLEGQLAENQQEIERLKKLLATTDKQLKETFALADENRGASVQLQTYEQRVISQEQLINKAIATFTNLMTLIGKKTGYDGQKDLKRMKTKSEMEHAVEQQIIYYKDTIGAVEKTFDSFAELIGLENYGPESEPRPPLFGGVILREVQQYVKQLGAVDSSSAALVEGGGKEASASAVVPETDASAEGGGRKESASAAVSATDAATLPETDPNFVSSKKIFESPPKTVNPRLAALRAEDADLLGGEASRETPDQFFTPSEPPPRDRESLDPSSGSSPKLRATPPQGQRPIRRSSRLTTPTQFFKPKGNFVTEVPRGSRGVY